MQHRVTGRSATPATPIHAAEHDLTGLGSADRATTTALAESLAALAAPDPGSGAWRWRVRRSLGGVRDLLTRSEATAASGGWLAARAAVAERERESLMTRLHRVGPQILEAPDVTRAADDLRRLLGDVQRHSQRRTDLVYDEVELDLGGSE